MREPQPRCAARLPGRGHERGKHRRDAQEHRDALALDRLERLGRIEATDQRELRTHRDRHVHATGHAEDVRERRRPPEHVVLGHGESPSEVLGVRTQLRVRKLYSLRLAGRPRREEGDRRIGCGIERPTARFRLCGTEQRIQRYHDGTATECTVEAGDRLRLVRHRQRDDAIRRFRRLGQRIELRVGHAPALERKRGPVGHTRRGLGEQGGERHASRR